LNHQLIRLSGYAFALTTVLAGVTDATAMALGGSEAHFALAGGILVLAFALGMLRRGPSGHLHLAAALMLGVASFVLPYFPRWLGMVALAALTLPVGIVGRRCAEVLANFGSGGRGALLTGILLGFFLITFGTGPLLFVLMLIGVLLPPRIAKQAESHASTAAERASVFLIALAGGAAFLALSPYLHLFDSGSVLQDTRRMVILYLCFLLGWWALGSALAEQKWLRTSASAMFCGALALAISKAATTVDRLSESNIFNSLVGWKPLLETLGETNRLTEIHWAWTPILTAVVGAFPVLVWSAAMRTTLGPRGGGMSTSRALGLTLAGGALAFLVLGSIAQDLIGDHRLKLSFLLALAAAISCAMCGPKKFLLPIAAAALVLPFWIAGMPKLPITGNPFYGYFEYSLVSHDNGDLSQATGNSSITRVLSLSSQVGQGKAVLADGRNIVSPIAELHSSWQVDALFPLLLRGVAARVLVVGTPDAATAKVLIQSGTQQLHWAVDPPQLLKVAREFLPDWESIQLAGVSSTAAEADGSFDYILLRESAIWEQRRSHSLRAAALRHMARKLRPGGLVAVALDPQRLVPGLVSQIGAVLGNATQSDARYFVVPHGLLPPTILVIAQKEGGEKHNMLRVRGLLDDLKQPIHETIDLPLAEFEPRHDQSDSFQNLLAGPLPHLTLALAGPAPYPTEQARPALRAGRVLGHLGSQNSLPWTLARHMNGQLWTLKDDQLGELEGKTDLNKEALDGLLALARQHPRSWMLQRLCESFAAALVHRRESDWATDFTQKLVDEVGWRTPLLLWASGEAALERLETDRARELAEEALLALPQYEPAKRLLRKANGEEDASLESRSEHEGHDH
jgi:SAM-dependent methyltransferase